MVTGIPSGISLRSLASLPCLFLMHLMHLVLPEAALAQGAPENNNSTKVVRVVRVGRLPPSTAGWMRRSGDRPTSYRLSPDPAGRRRGALRAHRGVPGLRRRRPLCRGPNVRQRAGADRGADGETRAGSGQRRSPGRDPGPFQHPAGWLPLRDESQRRAARRALRERQLVSERMDGHLGYGRVGLRERLDGRAGDPVQDACPSIRRSTRGDSTSAEASGAGARKWPGCRAIAAINPASWAWRPGSRG